MWKPLEQLLQSDVPPWTLHDDPASPSPLLQRHWFTTQRLLFMWYPESHLPQFSALPPHWLGFLGVPFLQTHLGILTHVSPNLFNPALHTPHFSTL